VRRVRQADAETANPDKLFRGDRAGRLPYRPRSCREIDFTKRSPCCRGRLFLLHRHPASAASVRTSTEPADQPATQSRLQTTSAMRWGRTVINKGRVSYFPKPPRAGGWPRWHSPEAIDAFRQLRRKSRRCGRSAPAVKASPTISAKRPSSGTACRIGNKSTSPRPLRLSNSTRSKARRFRHHVMNELLVKHRRCVSSGGFRPDWNRDRSSRHPPRNPTAVPRRPPSGPLRPKAKDLSSPALSQDKPGDTIKGPEDRSPLAAKASMRNI